MTTLTITYYCPLTGATITREKTYKNKFFRWIDKQWIRLYGDDMLGESIWEVSYEE